MKEVSGKTIVQLGSWVEVIVTDWAEKEKENKKNGLDKAHLHIHITQILKIIGSPNVLLVFHDYSSTETGTRRRRGSEGR